MEKIIIQVDEDLSGLIPAYLKNQRAAVEKMRTALDARDYETIRVTGHGMKGTGAGYGFEEISEIGSQLERAAKGKDAKGVPPLILRLADYLARIEVEFIPEEDD